MVGVEDVDTADSPRQRIVVFGDDWGRHPSSAQHIVRHLLGKYRVDWINTVGTRRVRLSWNDFHRGIDKLANWIRLRPPAEKERLPEGLIVHAPAHWPGFRHPIERRLNGWMLWRALRSVLLDRPKPVAVVTTLPITADLARATSELNWIYYCVDDLSQWPGLDRYTLQAMEIEQLHYVTRNIAVSRHLQDHLRALSYTASLVTHGVDRALWQIASHAPRGLTRPVAMFWGLIDRRLDAELCLEIAKRCELRMIGPRAEIDPRLLDAPITWVGNVPYEALAQHAHGADVLVMPYADLPVTRAMQPLKLKEYLATGLPVIATPLPANREWADALDLAGTADRFTERCLERAISGVPPEQAAARARLVTESWAAKALQFEQCILGLSATATT